MPNPNFVLTNTFQAKRVKDLYPGNVTMYGRVVKINYEYDENIKEQQEPAVTMVNVHDGAVVMLYGSLDTEVTLATIS
jgi:hypothetical protein